MAGRRRPARYGLLVQFESRPGELELGRLVDSTIWINDAHPACARAVGSRSLGYHTALTVGLELLALLSDNAHRERRFYGASADREIVKEPVYACSTRLWTFGLPLQHSARRGVAR